MRIQRKGGEPDEVLRTAERFYPQDATRNVFHQDERDGSRRWFIERGEFPSQEIYPGDWVVEEGEIGAEPQRFALSDPEFRQRYEVL